MKLRCVLVLCGCSLLLGQAVHAQKVYFPNGVLDEYADTDRSLREWYSKCLEAMGEPSLWELSKKKESHAYRFLYLRSFDNPIAVRVVMKEDGTGILTTKILSGQADCDPGPLVQNEERGLSKPEMDHVLRLFRKTNFWKIPSYPQPPNYFHRDGAEWITEGVKDRIYHIVGRWSPERREDRAFGEEFLFNLAKLKLLYTEVY